MSSLVDPRDWETIWKSELAARAVDRECLEQVVWAARAWERAAAQRHSDERAENAPGRAGADAQAGAAPIAAAPGAGDEMERLRRRVAELERELAERS